jgi:hypothetical protein
MNAESDEAKRPAELSWWQLTAAVLVACLMFAAQRPDAFFHPQFWAEDGRVFFAEAYNYGWWPALFRTYAGYYDALPRLGAGLAMLVPFSRAPLLMNVLAVAFQAVPVGILLSARSSSWGSLRYRAMMAALYLALPNSREIGAVLTNSQWVFVLAAFLVLVARPPGSVGGKAFDASILLIGALTGPFCFFLLPIQIRLAWKRRGAWQWTEAGILFAGCLVQGRALLASGLVERANAPLGQSLVVFTRILGGHIFLGTLLGSNQLASFTNPLAFVLLLCAAVGGTALLVACFTRSSAQMRLLLLLSFAIFAASLASPQSYPAPGFTRWQALAEGGGIRYWFLPTIAFTWSLLWCIRSRIRVLRPASAVLLIFMCFGVARDWQLPAFSDLHFPDEAKRLDATPAGVPFVMPENPQGWTLALIKHETGR